MRKLIGFIGLFALIVTLSFILVPTAWAGGAREKVTTADIQPESCATCHSGAGAKHQASYDQLYQDGVIKVTDLAYSFSSSPDTHNVTFKMTKDGAPFDGTGADSLGIYFTPYTGTSFQFEPAAGRLSIKGKLTYDGAGGITSTIVEKSPSENGFRDYLDLNRVNGLIVVYGRDEVVGRLPARIRMTKYPFAGLLETGAGVDYVSAANNAGCEKCHTDPYLKHGYIYGQVYNDAANDFYTCKACHLDDGEGGHFIWQLLVDDPQLIIDMEEKHGGDWEESGDAKLASYAYRTTLMNDVHMSHAMEFPYPQSMSNCVTCHEGKLDIALADANFTVETCKSCHAVTGSEKYETNELALKTLLTSPLHDSMDLNSTDCTSCHKAGGMAPAFSKIHTGYTKSIFTADGLKYSEAVTVTIDSASLAGNKLTFKFSAAESPDIAGLNVADIEPTVMVGLYGYDTKDYIIGPHERLFDDNGDGEISRADQRTLEYGVGKEHPRYKTVSAGGGKWEVVADLSEWADLIAGNTVRRVEIAVMPALKNADDVEVALNAPSRTFDLGANAFDDDFYKPIVKVADSCNNCHEALATTFHSPDRGGNIVACRLCHMTKSGGSHLEMQSRSIDSYVHAIHSFQPFDIGDIDFADPVEALHYEHHIGFPYPTHGVTNCESCHIPGTNEVPDQSKSLPGILSKSDTLQGKDRNIGAVPSYVTGPASRACGGCHRAVMINEDEASELISFNQHTKQGGYLFELVGDLQSTIRTVIDKAMAIFD